MSFKVGRELGVAISAEEGKCQGILRSLRQSFLIFGATLYGLWWVLDEGAARSRSSSEKHLESQSYQSCQTSSLYERWAVDYGPMHHPVTGKVGNIYNAARLNTTSSKRIPVRKIFWKKRLILDLQMSD